MITYFNPEGPGWPLLAATVFTAALGWGEHGVPCVQEPKDVFGARITQYLDPDGMAISVSEEHRAG